MQGGQTLTIAACVAGTLVLAIGCAERRLAADERPREAWAELKTAQGDSVGSAFLRSEGGRVRIVVQAQGLTPGRHGIHIHAVGRCEPPDFQSAGGHLNPLDRRHGLESPDGPHAGDLPDLEADESGRAEYVAVTDRVTLEAGPSSVFDADGSAVVVHAKPDDQRTDPAGNAGERLLCGRIVGVAPSVSVTGMR